MNSSHSGKREHPFGANQEQVGLKEAEAILTGLAEVFFPVISAFERTTGASRPGEEAFKPLVEDLLSVEDTYRTLVEQIPAVVFMAYLDRGVSEAYVSPQIEAMLGFSQQEWLNDPIRWYQQIHPDDRGRWNIEAAQMFLSGEPLRSVYRVIARDGHIIWFQCEAKMVRFEDGRPRFIHGVAFDITELKQTEKALKRREEELRALTASLLSVQDEERRRIARELHDGTAQNLAALVINLSLLMNSPGPGGSSWNRTVSDSMELAEQCSREVRNLSYLLHPPLLDDLGLASALRSFVAGFNRRTHIKVALDLPPKMGRLAAEVETALFRIVQEGLGNVHRHSDSRTAAIRIALSPEEIRLEVEDEGSGKPTAIKPDVSRGLGIGISSMRERAQQLGGTLAFVSGPEGTRFTVVLPLGGEV